MSLEVHDTHHPLGPSLYYEDQRGARQETHRGILEASGCRNISAISSACWRAAAASWVTGRRLSYVDLSLFQIVAGLRYAFPKRMKAFERSIPGLVDLHDRVAVRPNIKAYLASERRIPFNEEGIFRRYRELDV